MVLLAEYDLEKAQEESVRYNVAHPDEYDNEFDSPVYRYYMEVDKTEYEKKQDRFKRWIQPGNNINPFVKIIKLKDGKDVAKLHDSLGEALGEIRPETDEKGLAEINGKYYAEIDREDYYNIIDKEMKNQRHITNIKEDVTKEDKKNYEKRHKRLKKILKDEGELWKIFAEIVNDEWFCNSEWDNFTERVTEEMGRRNPDDYWETPDPDKQVSDTGSDEFFSSSGESLLGHFGIDTFCDNTSNKIKINEYGRMGLHINTLCRDGSFISRFNEDARDIIVLPACHDGFYRDWEHNGIYVAEIREG